MTAQYSSLENPMNRGNWQPAGHGVAKSWTQLRTTRKIDYRQWLSSYLSQLPVIAATITSGHTSLLYLFTGMGTCTYIHTHTHTHTLLGLGTISWEEVFIAAEEII